MWWFMATKRDIERLEERIAELAREFHELRCDLRELNAYVHRPRLSRIKILIQGDSSMATVGPVTLTTPGQVAKAIVFGFDQNGNPMPADFVMPAVTWAIDQSAIATIAADPDGVHEDVTAVANGTANLTASLTSAEGLALVDVEQVIVNIPTPPPPTPVLTSIKVGFE